jgi:hypothetical protein
MWRFAHLAANPAVAIVVALAILMGVTLVATSVVASAIDPPGDAGPSPECQTGELLVKFRPGVDPEVVIARHGGTLASEIEDIDVYVVAVAPGTVDQKVAEFSADPDVEFAEPNSFYSVPEAASPCVGTPRSARPS